MGPSPHEAVIYNRTYDHGGAGDEGEGKGAKILVGRWDDHANLPADLPHSGQNFTVCGITAPQSQVTCVACMIRF